jgi:hypothetical protein
LAADEGYLLATKANSIWKARYHVSGNFRDSILLRSMKLESLVSRDTEEVEF